MLCQTRTIVCLGQHIIPRSFFEHICTEEINSFQYTIIYKNDYLIHAFIMHKTNNKLYLFCTSSKQQYYYKRRFLFVINTCQQLVLDSRLISKAESKTSKHKLQIYDIYKQIVSGSSKKSIDTVIEQKYINYFVLSLSLAMT